MVENNNGMAYKRGRNTNDFLVVQWEHKYDNAIFELSLKYPYYKTGELKIYQHGSLLLNNNGYTDIKRLFFRCGNTEILQGAKNQNYK